MLRGKPKCDSALVAGAHMPAVSHSTETSGCRRADRQTRCSLGLFVAAMLLFAVSMPGQQRTSAFELYATAGTYYFGSSPNLLKSGHWSPQVSLGALVPVGSNWAIMADGTYSRLNVNEGLHHPETRHPASLFYKANPAVPNEDMTTQRMLAVFPSVVRLIRWNRFTFYFGGGAGFERHRQTIRHRRVWDLDAVDVEDVEFRSRVESGALLVANGYARDTDFSTTPDNVTNFALFAHGGVLVSLTGRILLRAGYSWILTYFDSPRSHSLAIGVGYRF